MFKNIILLKMIRWHFPFSSNASDYLDRSYTCKIK